MHVEVSKNIIFGKKSGWLSATVLDSMDNYKILSERMNVLPVVLAKKKPEKVESILGVKKT